MTNFYVIELNTGKDFPDSVVACAPDILLESENMQLIKLEDFSAAIDEVKKQTNKLPIPKHQKRFLCQSFDACVESAKLLPRYAFMPFQDHGPGDYGPSEFPID